MVSTFQRMFLFMTSYRRRRRHGLLPLVADDRVARDIDAHRSAIWSWTAWSLIRVIVP